MIQQQNKQKFVEMLLPLNENTLCDNIKIVFVGSTPPNRVESKSLLKVRRIKILNALKWLIAHNVHYKDIVISKDNISKLPLDDIPDSLWETMDVIDDNESVNNGRESYANENIVSDLGKKDEDPSEDIPITLNTSAVVDVDCVDSSFDNINKHLLKTVFKDNDKIENTHTERSYYMIPRGEQPVLQFGNSQLLPCLFPTLFPYGVGSPDDDNRKQKSSYKKDIQYLLSYCDKRFEKHSSFIFVVFNILQRRNACYKAKLMMEQPYSQTYANLISKVKSSDVEKALKIISKNEINNSKGICDIDEGVKKLVKQVKTVGGNVPGSSQSRSSLRNNIHAMIYCKGLPSIFLTINPADTYNPVALHFAGVNLNLDEIIKETFPSAYERAQHIQ